MISGSDAMQAPVFFTICSKNLLAYAKTYVDSVKTHHPDSDVYIFLADRFLGPKIGLEDATVVTLEEHGGTYFRDMMFRYNITEFNTSIKPFCFLYLFNKYKKGTGVVYMDPDTWIHSPLVEVCDGFSNGSDCVVTPHLTEPMGYTDLTDRGLLRYGAYNFGFVGISNSERNEEIVCWWADELRENCTIDFENGLFVDQKYGDLFPSFFENTLILREPGYNVAYWNLFSRTLEADQEGRITVNKRPLRFLHFSGANTDCSSPMISRHCQYLTKNSKKIYGRLLESWAKVVDGNLHTVHLDQGYSFFWNSAEKSNEHTPQSQVDDSAVLLFERTHWLFMAQYLTVDTYKDWSHREAATVSILIEGMDGFTKNEEKSVFCNGCMSWSLAMEWSKDYRCQCGASMMDRLVNAFLYQELKTKENVRILASKSEDYFATIEKSAYFSRLEFVDDINCCESSKSQPGLILSYKGIEILEELVENELSKVFPPMIVGIDNLSDTEVQNELHKIMKDLNSSDEVRASLFTGLSVNHMVHCEDVGLVYVENLSLEDSVVATTDNNTARSLLSVDAA